MSGDTQPPSAALLPPSGVGPDTAADPADTAADGPVPAGDGHDGAAETSSGTAADVPCQTVLLEEPRLGLGDTLLASQKQYWYNDPGYPSRKNRKFRTDKFDT